MKTISVKKRDNRFNANKIMKHKNCGNISVQKQVKKMHKIRYEKTARNWREALPIGNGFTGVMVYGSLQKEKLCFNDGTLWSGYPKDYNSPDSLANLDKVRNLIFEGRNSEADALCEEKLKGFYSETFLPLGDVLLAFSGADKNINSRTLDLSKGMHTVESNGIKSEVFSSYPDKVTVYKIKSNQRFSVKIKAKSALRHTVGTASNELYLYGNAPDYVAPNYLRTELFPVKYNQNKGMAFCLCAQIFTDGTLVTRKHSLKITGATEVTIYFATATGFNGFDKMPCTDVNTVIQKCKAHLNSVEKNYNVLKERHINDFSNLYNQQSISFNYDTDIPTDELLGAVKKGGNEKALCELLYNYGKYMMISGSRNGGQPLNLQGIWNHSVRPPWSSNYTVNINTQMNYWGASRAGLSECIEPLIQMVYETLQNGKKTAEINYRCRGFACNHNVDIWRKTPPVRGDANYMFEPLCGVWLANEIYAHYKNGLLNEYQDKTKEIVTEAARFTNDYLVLHNGQYVVCPSVSPENVFMHNGKRCKLDYASSFDMGLVRQVFKNALEISDDENLKTEIAEKYSKLYPFKNGANGICEWHKDYDTPEKGHRHFSPLYAFYPANLIGYYENKAETEWIKRLFQYRLAHSGQHIGWSAAWAICLAARLRDAETARSVIKGLLNHAIFSNLFCVHPPFYFQIDGNLGFVAGINEMLLTEENGVIELLPALPENFAESGEVKAMLVNGAKVSFKWNKGMVTEISSDKPISVYTKSIADNVNAGKNISFIKTV